MLPIVQESARYFWRGFAVGDPRAVAVACREMHAIRRCKHLLQVALAVGKGLPQVKVTHPLLAAS